MAPDEVLDDGLADRRREIHELNSEIAGARIILARLVTRRRQFDEGNMFADSNRLRIRRNGAHERPGFAIGREGQSGFDFRVPGKVLRVREIESAPRSVDAELSLLTTLQRAGNSVDITQIKSRRVHE